MKKEKKFEKKVFYKGPKLSRNFNPIFQEMIRCSQSQILSLSPKKSSLSLLPALHDCTQLLPMASVAATTFPSMARPAARGIVAGAAASTVPLPRAGVASPCPTARSLGFAARGTDPRLAIHVSSRRRAASASAGSRLARAVATMAKKSVGDLAAADLEGKRVLLRADLNVPLDASQNITDDTRVIAAIPTIKHLIGNGAKVILCSHLVSRKTRHPDTECFVFNRVLNVFSDIMLFAYFQLTKT